MSAHTANAVPARRRLLPRPFPATDHAIVDAAGFQHAR